MARNCAIGIPLGQDELGQYDYGAKFYDPEIARWNVIDPMAENHYDTNPYHYVLNNPMLYMDYMGLDTTYNGGRLKEVKITGPAKGTGSGNSYYGYGSGWGDYDPFDTDNGYGGSGDFGSFSYMMPPPPPPVLSSSSGAFTSLDNRGANQGGDSWDRALSNNLGFAGDLGDPIGSGAKNILAKRGAYLPRGEIFSFQSSRLVTVRTPLANILTNSKVLNTVRVAGKIAFVAGIAATAYDVGADISEGKYKSAGARAAVFGVAAGAAFIPVVGWGVAAGIGVADYIWGDDFYNWVEKQ